MVYKQVRITPQLAVSVDIKKSTRFYNLDDFLEFN
ncbi:MAG: hypothetical protein ACJA2S_003913 [Cyclobacteriaceae bacterium]|jgi:hypothetical protein